MPIDVWEIYFGKNYDDNPYFRKTNPKILLPDSKIYVYQCIFQNFTDGAISISGNSNLFFMHSNCFFTNCSKPSNGGAVYFSCQSHIVQHRCCTTNSYVKSDEGCQSDTEVGSGTQNKNYFIECAVSLGKHESSAASFICRSGNIFVSYTNSSSNYMYKNSGIYVRSGNANSSVNFSTMACNHAVISLCLDHSLGTVYRDFMNIMINNTQDTTKHGCEYTEALCIVEKCTILGPFGKGPAITASGNGQFQISQSTIDEKATYIGPYSTTEISNSSYFKQLSHVMLYECAIDSESVRYRILNNIISRISFNVFAQILFDD